MPSWRDESDSGYFGQGDGQGISVPGYFGTGNSTGKQGFFGQGGDGGVGYFGLGGNSPDGIISSSPGYWGQGDR